MKIKLVIIKNKNSVKGCYTLHLACRYHCNVNKRPLKPNRQHFRTAPWWFGCKGLSWGSTWAQGYINSFLFKVSKLCITVIHVMTFPSIAVSQQLNFDRLRGTPLLACSLTFSFFYSLKKKALSEYNCPNSLLKTKICSWVTIIHVFCVWLAGGDWNTASSLCCGWCSLWLTWKQSFVCHWTYAFHGLSCHRSFYSVFKIHGTLKFAGKIFNGIESSVLDFG